MSALPMLAFAAVYAGAVWFERWQVHREAHRRTVIRRHLRHLDEPLDAIGVASEVSDPLIVAIRRAVRVGDLACSHADRFARRSDANESPFQLRRTRVLRSIQRFEGALHDVEQQASRWLDSTTGASSGGPLFRDHQHRYAVERLTELLGKRRPEPESLSTGPIDAAIELLELTWAKLGRVSASGGDHPFRH